MYSASNGPQGPELSNTMGYPVAPSLKSENIGIEKATRYKYGGRGVKYKNKELDLQIELVDNDFFSMFSFPVVKGNTANPLADLASAVISEDATKRLFGEENPVGKTISTNIGGRMESIDHICRFKRFS